MFGRGLGLFLSALLVCACSKSGGEAEQVVQQSSFYDVDIEVKGDWHVTVLVILP